MKKLALLTIAVVAIACVGVQAHAANTESLTLVTGGMPFSSCAQNGSQSATLFPYWSSSPGEQWQGNKTDEYPLTLPPGLTGTVECEGGPSAVKIVEDATGPHCPCMFTVADEQYITVLVASPHTIESKEWATTGTQCVP